jgi:hypothetical protein
MSRHFMYEMKSHIHEYMMQHVTSQGNNMGIVITLTERPLKIHQVSGELHLNNQIADLLFHHLLITTDLLDTSHKSLQSTSSPSSRRTARRPPHIQQNIQHVHTPHIRSHGRLIDLGAPLIQQRIERQRQPILILARAPTRTAVGPLTPVGVVSIRVAGVIVCVVAWRRHNTNTV